MAIAAPQAAFYFVLCLKSPALQSCRNLFGRSTRPTLFCEGRFGSKVGFAVNPRRWVVERFFAWIGRNRRLAKDFEATVDSARAFLYAASVMLLVRRIARAS
jgi:transposase